MLLKILVVIWFLKVLTNLFTNNYISKIICESLGESTKDIKDYNSATDEQKATYGVSILVFLLYAIWHLLVFVIDIFMMLAMLKYDKTYFTLIFLILTLLQFVIGLINGKIASYKKNSDKPISDTYFENAKNLTKITFIRIIQRIINIVYWGYAIYLLFF